MTTLTRVQQEALSASFGKRGFAYLMEMGLGKTRTALVDALSWCDGYDVTRLIVLAPNSFKQGWINEAKRWALPISGHVFESGADYDNSAFLRKAHSQLPMLVVNYEAIRSTSTQEYIKRFIGNRRAMIVADESIKLGTHDSTQTKAAIDIAKLCYVRRILSGKWVTQGPHNIWPQARFLGEFDGVNYYAFRARYCKLGGFKGKSIVGEKNPEELADRISPFVFKAFKSEYMDLGKIYTTREYKLHPTVKQHYDEMLHDFITFINENESVSVDVAIAKYGKMQQIQTGFVYDENRVARQLVPDKDNTRLQAMLEFLDTEMTSKLLIVYHHKAVYDMLVRNIPNTAYIRGNMSVEEVEHQKDRFNNDPSFRVMLLQDDASKYGHTLLGGPEIENRCHTMFFFENTYSLDTRSQIEDRNHRMGQLEDNCTYVDLIGTPMDTKVIAALQRKENFFQLLMALIGSTPAK